MILRCMETACNVVRATSIQGAESFTTQVQRVFPDNEGARRADQEKKARSDIGKRSISSSRRICKASPFYVPLKTSEKIASHSLTQRLRGKRAAGESVQTSEEMNTPCHRIIKHIYWSRGEPIQWRREREKDEGSRTRVPDNVETDPPFIIKYGGSRGSLDVAIQTDLQAT
ncbi:hypothetical protein DL93DRAFT_2093144 [Clavulina sp. PMI_390]|nr:hypothetical protein DL93DRAFT_2093144 [Clavulina sp. PMI_390]